MMSLIERIARRHGRPVLPTVIALGPPATPRETAARILQAECNAGRLGVAAVILRSLTLADRDRVLAELDRAYGRRDRGQALIEAALVMPLLLLLLLGAAAVGLALLLSMNLTHAAVEGAVLGAQGAPGDRCAVALDGATTALGRTVEASCTDADGWVTLHLEQTAPLPVPGFEGWTIAATEKSAIRSPAPSP